MTGSTSSFKLRLVFATALFLFAANTSAQQNLNVQSLDAFLEGFDDECRYSSELTALTDNLLHFEDDKDCFIYGRSRKIAAFPKYP